MTHPGRVGDGHRRLVEPGLVVLESHTVQARPGEVHGAVTGEVDLDLTDRLVAGDREADGERGGAASRTRGEPDGRLRRRRHHDDGSARLRSGAARGRGARDQLGVFWLDGHDGGKDPGDDRRGQPVDGDADVGWALDGAADDESPGLDGLAGDGARHGNLEARNVGSDGDGEGGPGRAVEPDEERVGRFQGDRALERPRQRSRLSHDERAPLVHHDHGHRRGGAGGAGLDPETAGPRAARREGLDHGNREGRLANVALGEDRRRSAGFARRR